MNTQALSTPARERNYGIDCLRIVAMMMVVVLHVLGQGGLLGRTAAHTAHSELLWALEILCYGAVNIYAMISGYVGLRARHRYASLVYLCFELGFYAALVTGAEVVLLLSEGAEITGRFLLSQLFPSVSDLWYFSSYFCLFFFMPLLNALVEHTPRAALRSAGVFVLLLCTVLRFASPRITHFAGGYSVVWLAILYVFGAYMAKYEPFRKLSAGKSLGLFFAFWAFTVAWRLLPGIEVHNRFVDYTSPTVLLGALFLVNAFAKMRVGAGAAKAIAAISPLTFGVYLFHCHPYVFGRMGGAFVWMLESPALVSVLLVLGVSLATYAACLALDKVRELLFRLCRMRAFSAWLARIIGKGVDAVLRLLGVKDAV